MLKWHHCYLVLCNEHSISVKIITGDLSAYFDCCSLRPWDCMNDVVQYERDFVIQTKTRHQTPIVHTTSVIAGSAKDEKTAAGRTHSRHSSMDHASSVTRAKRVSLKHARDPSQENASTSALCDSESSLSAGTTLFCSYVLFMAVVVVVVVVVCGGW